VVVIVEFDKTGNKLPISKMMPSRLVIYFVETCVLIVAVSCKALRTAMEKPDGRPSLHANLIIDVHTDLIDHNYAKLTLC
jgi:hypothetical protein